MIPLAPGATAILKPPLHAIRDCSDASRVWIKLINPSCPSLFFSGDIKVWIANNLKHNWGLDHRYERVDTFITTAWTLRNKRNKFVHEGISLPPTQTKQEILSSLSLLSEARKMGRLARTTTTNTASKKFDGEPPLVGLNSTLMGLQEATPVILVLVV